MKVFAGRNFWLTYAKNQLMRYLLLLLLPLALLSCDNFGKKYTKDYVEVYYKEGITEEQASKTADVFLDIDQGNSSAAKKSMQLVKVNDTVTFRMVVNEEKMKEVPDESFLAIGFLISQRVFDGAPVNMDLTDNRLKTIKSLPYSASSTEKFLNTEE